jgi:hypothetical protein
LDANYVPGVTSKIGWGWEDFVADIYCLGIAASEDAPGKGDSKVKNEKKQGATIGRALFFSKIYSL